METIKETGTNKPNNYCVNCKHCVTDLMFERECRQPKTITEFTNSITGRHYKITHSCDHVRYNICHGVYFEPKQFMWSKFVSLFKHK